MGWKKHQEQWHVRCDWQGCHEKGIYPAPRSADNIRARYYFCLAHVRIYNARWDYFAGKGVEALEQVQREALYGHSPIIRRGHLSDYWQFFHAERSGNRVSSDAVPVWVAKEDKPFLAVLGLEVFYHWREVKQQYKLLVKQYHPDSNASGDEETIKAINYAYNYLKGKYETTS